MNILIFDVFYMFRTRGFILGRLLYMQVWYSVFYMLKLQEKKALVRYRSIKYLNFLSIYFKISNILCLNIWTFQIFKLEGLKVRKTST